MDFSLSFAQPFALTDAAAQKQEILATNREAWNFYGLQLTPEEAGMLTETAERALSAGGLVQFGSGITPRLIHWFLPAGYFGWNYAAQIAELTEAFYRIKSELQALYDGADDPECMLSDNALLDYMYKFYTSPSCAGDIAEMTAQTERIVVMGMRRLLEYRAMKRKQHAADLGDPELRMLYADRIAQETADSELEDAYAAEEYDYEYREMMHQDVFGNYARDYGEDAAEQCRGTYAEELTAILMRNPEYLLPSAAQEAEWAARVEEWEDADAAAKGAESE